MSTWNVKSCIHATYVDAAFDLSKIECVNLAAPSVPLNHCRLAGLWMGRLDVTGCPPSLKDCLSGTSGGTVGSGSALLGQFELLPDCIDGAGATLTGCRFMGSRKRPRRFRGRLYFQMAAKSRAIFNLFMIDHTNRLPMLLGSLFPQSACAHCHSFGIAWRVKVRSFRTDPKDR
jgi:hypothetical protein